MLSLKHHLTHIFLLNIQQTGDVKPNQECSIFYNQNNSYGNPQYKTIHHR